MELQRQQTLWAIALENYQAAVLTAQHGWHNVSVACSYYAVFTAMWVALGDPPRRYWEHRGIVKPFAVGQWHTPPVPMARELIKAVHQLYDERLDADYRAVRFTQVESTAGVTTAGRVLRLIADALNLSLGGIIP
jgi:uncharacterized protein (UPF0332 family)